MRHRVVYDQVSVKNSELITARGQQRTCIHVYQPSDKHPAHSGLPRTLHATALSTDGPCF